MAWMRQTSSTASGASGVSGGGALRVRPVGGATGGGGAGGGSSVYNAFPSSCGGKRQSGPKLAVTEPRPKSETAG